MLDFLTDETSPSRFISGKTFNGTTDDRWLSEHVYLDDNDVLRCAPDFDIEENLDELNVLLNSYDTQLRKIYHQKMRYYKGDHVNIRNRFDHSELNSDKNRVAVNVTKNLVNTFNGYFIGIPPKVTCIPSDKMPQTLADKVNDLITTSFSNSDSDDVFYEWAKKADIYGRGYCVAYIANNDDKDLKFTNKAPENAFVVYSNNNDCQEMFGVTFDLVGGKYFGTLNTPNNFYQFDSSDLSATGGFEASVNWRQNKIPNPVGKVLMTELPENNERLGLFDDLISLVDSQDKVLSEKIDDVDYFSNAILLTKGLARFTPQQKQAIKRWRVMQIQDQATDMDADVKYLAKPDSDTLQENTLKHITEKIYDGAQVINLADPALSSSASGKALEQKMQPMQMLSAMKGEKMRTSIKQLITMILTYNHYSEDDVENILRNLKVEFTPNIPHSDLDESNIVKNLNGIVSKRLLLSYLSRVQNIDDEIKAEQTEQENNIKKFGQAGDDPDDQNNQPDNKPTETDDQNSGPTKQPQSSGNQQPKNKSGGDA